jgi:hypothetical protein
MVTSRIALPAPGKLPHRASRDRYSPSRGPRDRGPRDRGPRDRGPRDRGPRDRGPRDRGPRDRGPRDHGPRDGCTSSQPARGWSAYGNGRRQHQAARGQRTTSAPPSEAIAAARQAAWTSASLPAFEVTSV